MRTIIPIKDNEKIVKDADSCAIINIDNAEYESALRRKAARKSKTELLERIDDLERRLENLERQSYKYK